MQLTLVPLFPRSPYPPRPCRKIPIPLVVETEARIVETEARVVETEAETGMIEVVTMTSHRLRGTVNSPAEKRGMGVRIREEL